ncbi:MAG TPA: AsmA-like C-terminal region-containing protein, partial [Caulobacteraceae bacterium]
GDWIGQVSWSQAAGARTQYHWRSTLTAADLHALGMPAGLEPKAPLPVDVSMTSAGGGFSGSALIAGGAFRFSASPAAKGRRRMTINGALDGKTLADLGLGPQGMISGPTGLNAVVDLAGDGLRGGHVQIDLQRAALSAPFVAWKKPAGRPMQIDADFVRKDGGVEASDVKGSGPGFALSASGAWKSGAGGVLHASDFRLEGAFDGSIDLGFDDSGVRLASRARYFDARRLLQQPERGAAATAGGGHSGAADKGFHVDAQLAQVRVSDTGMIHNVRIEGQVSPADQRRLDVSVGREDGAELVSLQLYPDAGGMAVNGQVSDVGEAAFVMFGRHSFQGGKAVVTGRLVEGGADLRVDMSKVRLVKAPALARILTIGSLHGMADTLNGAGIEFTKVVAPVSVRGAKLTIGRARATGPAMGITTQGVIDIDNRTVDLSGGIAPSYILNSAVGAVPVVGQLLVSHKGEGMFGLTYSARGAFASPKITVNPLSLAAPGILRRIFEGHSQVAHADPAG